MRVESSRFPISTPAVSRAALPAAITGAGDAANAHSISSSSPQGNGTNTSAPTGAKAAPAPAPITGGYVNPALRIDPRVGLVLFQIRNSETGEVERQIPSEAAIARYKQNLPASPLLSFDGAGQAKQRNTPIDRQPDTGNPGFDGDGASVEPAGAPRAQAAVKSIPIGQTGQPPGGAAETMTV